MAEAVLSEPAVASLRCPTCRLLQVPADVCRRCRCDLQLVRAAIADHEARRRECLLNLRGGDLRAALADARECVALQPDADSYRLLAVCELLNRNWGPALAAARHAAEPQNATAGQMTD